MRSCGHLEQLCGSELRRYSTLRTRLNPGDVQGDEPTGIVEEVGAGSPTSPPLTGSSSRSASFALAAGPAHSSCRPGARLCRPAHRTRATACSATPRCMTATKALGGAAADDQAGQGPHGWPDEQYRQVSGELPTAWQAIEHALAPGRHRHRHRPRTRQAAVRPPHVAPLWFSGHRLDTVDMKSHRSPMVEVPRKAVRSSPTCLRMDAPDDRPLRPGPASCRPVRPRRHVLRYTLVLPGVENLGDVNACGQQRLENS